VITQDQIIKLISRQKRLNFNPGDEFLYCNTGYTLLAEIIKNVSGLTLRQFTDKYIFKPLGMNDTHFQDDYREIVKGRAYSYVPKGKNDYMNSALSFSTVGATSMFTTVEDETKWMMNYLSGKVGGMNLVDKMFETAVLNNGKRIEYAFGIYNSKYNGWRMVYHTGSDAGYRTYFCLLPETQFGVVVFSNFSTSNTSVIGKKLVDIFVKSKEDPPNMNHITDSTFLKRLCGTYFSDRGSIIRLIWEENKLISRTPGQTTGGIEFQLIQNEKNLYLIKSVGTLTIIDPVVKDSIAKIVIETPNDVTIYNRKKSMTIDPEEQKEYKGDYYSNETGTTYTIDEKDGKLIIKNLKYSDVELNPFAKDHFSTVYGWMSTIKFVRNKKEQILGFEVNSGRILHLFYGKVKNKYE